MASEFMVGPTTKKTWWIRPPKIVKIKKMIMHVSTCWYHALSSSNVITALFSLFFLSIVLESILAFLLELTADWVFWISNKMIVLINCEVVLYELNKRNKQSMKNYKNRIKPKFGFYLGEQYQLNKHIELSKTMINKTWIKRSKMNRYIPLQSISATSMLASVSYPIAFVIPGVISSFKIWWN